MTNKEYISHSEMNSYYSEVVRKMAVRAYTPQVIFAPMRGGADFGIKLSNYFDIPFEPITWQTRDGAKANVNALKLLCSKYHSQRVLLVDDICDSGRTLGEILQTARPLHAAICTAVAIDNLESGVDVDYSGREICRSQHPQWFVFPWENWWVE